MLLIGQRIDGGNGRIPGEFFHVLLRIGAKDGAVHHPSQHARGVFDRLAAANLDFSRRQKNHLPAEFPNPNVE